MRKIINKNKLVFGIIFVFVCSIVIPSSNSTIINRSMTLEKNELYNRINYNDVWIVDDEGDGDFTSVQDAIDNAIEGDTICVYSGIYYENVEIEKGKNNLNIIGYNEEYPPTGSDDFCPIIHGDRTTNVISAEDSNNIKIDGFNITGSKLSGEIGGIYLRNCEHCVISNNKVWDNYYGIYFDYTDNTGIWLNNVALNEMSGIVLVNSHRNLISHNHAENNGWNGMITDGARLNIITFNSFSYNTHNGLKIWQDSFSTPACNSVRYNNIVDNGEPDENCKSFTIWHNNWWGNTESFHIITGIPPKFDLNPAKFPFYIPLGKCI